MEIDAEGVSAAEDVEIADGIVWQCEMVANGQSWWADYNDTDGAAIEARFQSGDKTTFTLPTSWDGRSFSIDLKTGQQVSVNGLRRRIRRVRNTYLGEAPNQA